MSLFAEPFQDCSHSSWNVSVGKGCVGHKSLEVRKKYYTHYYAHTLFTIGNSCLDDFSAKTLVSLTLELLFPSQCSISVSNACLISSKRYNLIFGRIKMLTECLLHEAHRNCNLQTVRAVMPICTGTWSAVTADRLWIGDNTGCLTWRDKIRFSSSPKGLN